MRHPVSHEGEGGDSGILSARRRALELFKSPPPSSLSVVAHSKRIGPLISECSKKKRGGKRGGFGARKQFAAGEADGLFPYYLVALNEHSRDYSRDRGARSSILQNDRDEDTR